MPHSSSGMLRSRIQPVLPISALHGLHVNELRAKLIDLLPPHPPYFPKDEMSDRDMRFFISEMIREKILSIYKQEIPVQRAGSGEQLRGKSGDREDPSGRDRDAR
jgi:GTPase Era involved in 16S rRNA processing